ncbi:hypothetical protein COLO4_04372 [Corchorus olitorius]|uniref:Uncharacterized protein n=1 Tax=Corchorus olitorius TaxID=93759 RepID=A0A1R3KUA7_9ROSI|nr:hypothetical protein COLO4_04372 [Corchorus olitorius]
MIGEGDLDVWIDIWIDKPPISFHPSPRDELNMPELKVSASIDFDCRMWKLDTVLELFAKEDAYRILCLAVPRRKVSDKLIWNEKRLGEFSIKSAYHVARRVFARSASLDVSKLPIWKLLWSTRVLPKIHHFV